LEKAVLLNSNIPEAHYNLAVALERVGKFDEAISQYEQALRIKPDFVEAQENLARLRSGQ
jgi:Flp pilus assembly protein TadD